jgi:AAA family ATP:ADP antiporter
VTDSTLDDQRAAFAAAAGAGVMIAQQVAAKATRDALFLSNFPVTMLPRIVIASAVVSALVVLAWAYLLRRRGPYPLMPQAFVASGLTMLAIGLVAPRAPGSAVIATYMHVAVLGPVLISGFWSLLNERFDPRAAKRTFGRVAAYGALGGLAGGVLAERVTTLAGATTMLPVLGVLHLACAGLAAGVRPAPARRSEPAAELPLDGVRVVLRTPYLQSLGLLVLLGAVSAALLDYAFKANAVRAMAGEAPLMRLFSAYYTGVALLAFAVQVFASGPMLAGAGLARTVATLPLATLVGSVVAVGIPGLASTVVARGADGVLRNSLFRSGYELLFTPIPARDRRASKIFVDVGYERAGDALGGAIVTALLAMALAAPVRALLWIAAALSGLAVAVALRIHRGYVATLESSLLAGDIALDAHDAQDATTRLVALRTQPLRIRASGTGPAFDPAAPAWFPVLGGPAPPPPGAAPVASARSGDTVAALSRRLLERAADLGSGDAARIRRALAAPLEPPLVPYALALLEHGELAPDVLRALQPLAAGVAGQLGDALVERTRPAAARRRIARLLGAAAGPRAVEALLHGLDDPAFEVRHACGMELARLRGRDATLVFDTERVFALVRREVEVERDVWQGQRDIERLGAGGSPADDYLSTRASASLEHVFDLLSLVLSPRPLRIAYRGLQGEDRMVRGLALEYLESVLPATIRERLWSFLEADANAAPSRRPREEVLEDLLRSHESIRIRLSELRGEPEA